MHRRQGNGSVKLGSADAEAVRPARAPNVPSSAATGKPSLRWSAPDEQFRTRYFRSKISRSIIIG